MLKFSCSKKAAIFCLLLHRPTKRRVLIMTTHFSVPLQDGQYCGYKGLLEAIECVNET